MRKLKKKGKVGKTEAGRLMLVNEEGQAFEADRTAILIWDKCDGQVTSESVAKEISQKTLQEESAVKEVVDRLVGEMEKVGLLESIE